VSYTAFLHTICHQSIMCFYVRFMSSQQSSVYLSEIITNCGFIILCCFFRCFFLFLGAHCSHLLFSFLSVDSSFSIFLDVFHLLL
jgi:hypothetical protein